MIMSLLGWRMCANIASEFRMHILSTEEDNLLHVSSFEMAIKLK